MTATPLRFAEITHHDAGPIDGSGRQRAAEWRLWMPGFATSHFPHDGTDAGKRAAHARALAAADNAFSQ